MKTILLAFKVAEAMTSENLLSIVKNQVGFEIPNDQFSVEEIELTDMNNISSEELALIIGEPTPSEAIYAVLTALANSKESIRLSKRSDNAPALAVAEALIAANGWDAPREDWQKNIEFPQLNEDLDQRKKELTNVLFKSKKSEAPAAVGQVDEDSAPDGATQQPAPVETPAPADANTATATPVSEPVAGGAEVVAPEAGAAAPEAPGTDEDDDPFAKGE